MNTLTDITANNTPDTAAPFKGFPATVTMTDGTVLTGTFLSVNSKGWNITVDGKTVSRGFNRVATVEVDDNDLYNEDDYYTATTGLPAELDNDTSDNMDAPGSDMDALVAELDGATTAQLAEMFGIAAKELRVTLRSLGMGVGKGHRYHLNADQINTVKAALTA